jgi:hypothetical protein
MFPVTGDAGGVWAATSVGAATAAAMDRVRTDLRIKILP